MFRRPITPSLAFTSLMLVNVMVGPLAAQDMLAPDQLGTGRPTSAAQPASLTADLSLEEPATLDLAGDTIYVEDSSIWQEYTSSPWQLNGWLSQGYTGNPDRPASNFNSPLAFNDRANDYQMNQLYLTLGKDVDVDCCGWDFGGRMDLMYGTDYYYLESNGLERRQNGDRHWNGTGPRAGGTRALYGLAMPQLYVDAMIPVGSGLKARFGHFYTILGYESPMAPQNFFYSHSHSFVYGNPRTHTGALFSYSPTTCFTFSAGLTNGWDNFDNPNGQLGFLMGALWDNGVESLGFSLHTGNEDPDGEQNRFLYSSVYRRQLNQRLQYVLQHDLGVEQAGSLSNSFETKDAYWYGLTSYLFLNLTQDFEVGLRAEWFRDEDNARIQQIPIDPLFAGSNYYNVALGANWRPTQNIVFRPEARYDWSNVELQGTDGVFNDFEDKRMWTFAFDVIMSF